MHPFPDLRAQIAGQLTALSAPGAPLHRDSDQSTARLYPRGDIGRARFQKDTIDWHLSQANPRLGGRTAIVTAGPIRQKTTLTSISMNGRVISFSPQRQE